MTWPGSLQSPCFLSQPQRSAKWKDLAWTPVTKRIGYQSSLQVKVQKQEKHLNQRVLPQRVEKSERVESVQKDAQKVTEHIFSKFRIQLSKPNNDVNNEDVQEGPQGVIAAAPELAEKDPRDVFDPANRLTVKALEDHAAVSSATTASPLVLGASAPELPWADTPDVNASKAFGSFPCDAGDAVLDVEESQPPKEQPKELQDISETPKIFSDPSAKVFQFDFSVFDFLKHEALRTPPDSPLEAKTKLEDFVHLRSDADTGGLRLGAVEAAPLQLPERNGLQVLWG
eukprot:symbB.v1.2.019165.t1/scaffold1555.1/size186957/19